MEELASSSVDNKDALHSFPTGMQTILSLMLEYPALATFGGAKLNRDVFRSVQNYVNSRDALVAALVQNPHGETVGLNEIEQTFGSGVHQHVLFLNELHGLPRGLLFTSLPPEQQEMVAIFLTTLKLLFAETTPVAGTLALVPPKKVDFALKLLRETPFHELRRDLEDIFFSFLYPDIYNHYVSLLKLTEKTHLKRELDVKKSFKQLLIAEGIRAQTHVRTKTIASLHQKIAQKNILLSQVLDIIGLRIIVQTKVDCYNAMSLILKKWPVMESKIKDYIAIPKNNGYQSIHLTVLYDSYPVEIQIRTEEMHYHAQFGVSAHQKYKNH